MFRFVMINKLYKMIRREFLIRILFVLISLMSGQLSLFAQGTQVDFSTIPKSGTALIYSHMDDDLIWMLPFWQITEKFIGGAMPASPSYRTIINQQQAFLDNNGYNISYQSNWYTPWDDITDTEYTQYYLGANPAYDYLLNDHLETRLYNNYTELSRFEINKIKAKLEQYFADPSMRRVITHNNWGEYGHLHHKGLNKAVRELAVKYRKDVWMLGCDNGGFVDVTVPNGITWTYGSFNTPDLYLGIRTIYQNNGRWTWYTDRTPSGDHKFIKIVDGGNDRSNILTGEEITYPGTSQIEPGAYIFDGNDDYLTLKGNNNPSFTIAMRIRPDQIREMDISEMSEYPLSPDNDRNLYLTADGHVAARIYDGSSRTTVSETAIAGGAWTHIAISGNRSSLKLYINGILDRTIATGTARTNYSTPEFILGQAIITSSYFSGQISDVRLYDHALTDLEVAQVSGMVYTITSSAATGGTITPSGSTQVVVGTNRTFVIAPNIGYHITGVEVDNVPAGAIPAYTFTSVTSNHSITASFSLSPSYTIVSSAGSGGSISPSGDVTVYQGTSQTFTITPLLGFKVSDVKVDGVSAGAVPGYTFNYITSGHTIEASFETTPVQTVMASAATGGSVTPSGTTQVNEGTDLTYSIVPAVGYRVADVLADGISVGAVSSYTFSNITSSHTISAVFSVMTYTLTASSASGGSIDPSGSLTVNHGASQSYTISPRTGYRISNIMVDNVSIGNPSEFTFSNISSNHTISATFALISNVIIASAGTGGGISPQGNITILYNGNQTFTITANTGYNISDVLIDDVSAGVITTYTFNNVITGHRISALFTPITYNITATAGTGGSISPSGNVTVNHGSNRTFTISPATGFQISDVRIDNISVGPVPTYTFSSISANHTISATFAVATYSVTAGAGTGGFISPSGTTTVIYGSNQVYTITPDIGYRISDVRVDNISVGAVSSYTLTNIRSNQTISVIFAIITYNLTSQSGAGGTVTPGGTTAASYGSSLTYSIVPNTGYYTADVIVDNVSVGPVSSFTFSNITGDHSITASFVIHKFTIAGNSGAGGSITPSGSSSVNYGSELVFTISPDAGFRILDVFIDNISSGPVSSYTFSNITSGHTISASFTPLTFSINSTSGTGGSVNPLGETTVIYGTDKSYTITPETGYQIADVMIDGQSAGRIAGYVFSNIKADHSIGVAFSVIVHTITAEANDGGTVTPSGKTDLNYGSGITYSFTPDFGYMVSDVRIDNKSIGSVSSYSFKNITNDHSVSVIFKPIPQYTISATAGEGGSINPEGSVTIYEGSDQTYSIVPEKGYRILDVIADNRSVGAVNEYTFRNIESDHHISATFAMNIGVNVFPNPFVDEINLYISAPENRIFEISVADQSGKVIYTLDNVDGNLIVPVTFRANSGFYILRVFTDGMKVGTIKLIKL